MVGDTRERGAKLRQFLVLLLLFAAVGSASSQTGTGERIFRCDKGIYTNDPQPGIHTGCREMGGGEATVTRTDSVTTGLAKPPSNWTRVAVGKDLNVYADYSSVRPQGRHIKAWTLWSYDKPEKRNGVLYLSIKELTYYDCKSGSAGVKSQIYFGDVFGTEDSLGSGSIEDEKVRFEDPPPQSLGAAVLGDICSRPVRK